VYPLAGSYHDAITYNDSAMVNVLTLLREIASGQNEFTFVSAADRARAAAAVTRGLNCILTTQILVQGRRTVWCQQHDLLTLAPTSARNYEMPSQSSGESAGVAIFLMKLQNPSPAVVNAVHAAAAWFEKTALQGVIFKPAPDGSGRRLVAAPGSPPLWPRYAEIGSDRPLFGERDKTIHDDVNEISQERRNGYAWFGDGPKRALDDYRKWAQMHPRAR
jgi:PelA/Pel-15E family pectate lyase